MRDRQRGQEETEESGTASPGEGMDVGYLRSKSRGGGFALLLLLTAVPAKAGVAAAGRAGMERVEPSGGGLGQCDCVRLNG